MNENHLLFGAAGIIMTVFGLLVYFAILSNVETSLEFDPKKQKIPGFSQIRELKEEVKEQIQNNEPLENFGDYIVDSSEAFKKQINEEKPTNLNSTIAENTTDVSE